MGDFCQEHAAINRVIDSIEGLQKDLRQSGGVLDKIYAAISSKVPWKTFALLVVLMGGIIGVTFTQLWLTIKDVQVTITKISEQQVEMKTTLTRIDKVVNHR